MDAQFEEFEPFLDNPCYNAIAEDSVQTTPSLEEVPAPKKKVVNRGVNFTIEEDKNLVSAWLNTSIDATQGTDQKAKTFWNRIMETYNSSRGPNHRVRTERSLSSRWASIQHAVNKFCGFLSQVEASRPSGFNELDKIQMAKEMFKDIMNTNFQFDHCWNLLRQQPKWNLYMGQSSSKRKHTGCSSTNPQEPINLDEGDNENSGSFSVEIDRPVGRKAEKEHRKKGKTDNKDLTDVFVQLTLDKKKEHEERMALAEAERERVNKEWQDHLLIENEKLQIEKVRADAASQRAECEKQRAIAKREKIEQQKKEREFQIMMTPLDNLSDVQRAYLQSLQAEILANRHL